MKNRENYFSASITSFGKGISNTFNLLDMSKASKKPLASNSGKGANEQLLQFIPSAYKKVAFNTLKNRAIKEDFNKTGEDLYKALNKYEREKGFKQTYKIRTTE